MSDEPTLRPGDVVGGRYRIREVIGRGGFSTIYRARQLSLGRDVALKVMRTDVSAIDDGPRPKEELIERFRREAKVVGRLTHPATVTLYDFGRTRDDFFFMALEYVEGTPLQRRRERTFAPKRVVSILEQALGSLQEAHDHGVVHRDIKPSNLMLFDGRDEPDRLKILDFGIAKLLEPTDNETIRKLTGEKMVIGTPRYLAPENATGRDPGPPADIYSLGLVAYELLLGEKAIAGDCTMAILDRQLSRDIQPEIEQRPGIPEPLRRIVNRMIQKPLSRRYSSAEEVARDVAALPEFGREFSETETLRERVDEPLERDRPLCTFGARSRSVSAEPRSEGEDALAPNDGSTTKRYRDGSTRETDRPADRARNDARAARSAEYFEYARAGGGATTARRRVAVSPDGSGARLARERPRPGSSQDHPPVEGAASRSTPEQTDASDDATEEDSDSPSAESEREERATFPPGDTVTVDCDPEQSGDGSTSKLESTAVLLALSATLLTVIAAATVVVLIS